MDSHRPDEDSLELAPRFGRAVRLLALAVVIALILLTVVPVLVRTTRPLPSPTTTQPGVVAVDEIR
ncbi:MAG: hypothetical protein OEM84_12890 [Acidimicrobiia bacterium]|nr:hypothetical protein [Acidimicrobiia bacterium]